MVSTVPGVGAGNLRAQGWSSLCSDACCSEKAPASWPGALALGLYCLGLISMSSTSSAVLGASQFISLTLSFSICKVGPPNTCSGGLWEDWLNTCQKLGDLLSPSLSFLVNLGLDLE